MSLLHQDSPDRLDDAARGESFTRGTSHLVIAAVVATIVVSIAIAAYVISGQKPPVATAQVLEIWAHPMHRTTPPWDANGVPMPQDSFDQVLVFVRVSLHNQSKLPLFLHQVTASATLDDGIHTSYAASATDYNRIFQAYPDLAQWRNTALPTEATLNPGQTTEGTFVSAFRMSKQQWDARKGLNFSFAFRYQPPLTVTPNVPVKEH